MISVIWESTNLLLLCSAHKRRDIGARDQFSKIIFLVHVFRTGMFLWHTLCIIRIKTASRRLKMKEIFLWFTIIRLQQQLWLLHMRLYNQSEFSKFWQRTGSSLKMQVLRIWRRISVIILLLLFLSSYLWITKKTLVCVGVVRKWQIGETHTNTYRSK